MSPRTRKPPRSAAADADTPAVGERNGRYSSSLEHGLALLRCFTAERPVLGIAQFADELDLGRSTAHRYAATLAVLGYLEQDAARRYRLAARAGDVGITALDIHPLRWSARAPLERLRDESGYTASLGVLEHGELLYLERIRGYGPRQREIDLGILGLRTGYRVPAHCTAMGKLLLAYLPEPTRREHLTGLRLKRYGPRSITTKTALGNELRRIPTDGLALSDQELAEVLLSIAAPVRDQAGTVVAALAVEAHTSMSTPEDLLRNVGPRLVSAAAKLSIWSSTPAVSTAVRSSL